jgi:hypothetical protein
MNSGNEIVPYAFEPVCPPRQQEDADSPISGDDSNIQAKTDGWKTLGHAIAGVTAK